MSYCCFVLHLHSCDRHILTSFFFFFSHSGHLPFRRAVKSISLLLPYFNCYTDFLVNAGGPFNGPSASL
jgi:hypothetical protein